MAANDPTETAVSSGNLTGGTKSNALTIHGKKWYFRLVKKTGEVQRSCHRARALMDDHNLTDFFEHLVICFTPDKIPGQTRPFRTHADKPSRLYAYFDSYVEFYEYIQKFPRSEWAFYEIIFGEFSQKPHFDIDISADACSGEDIAQVGERVRDELIRSCLAVTASVGLTLNLERDILLFSSHGPNKCSYHLVIPHYYHEGNREARAFYDAVVANLDPHIAQFVDSGVYNSRQQFRILGSSKVEQNRPKILHQIFTYQDREYLHAFSEASTDPIQTKLNILHESLVSFTAGTTYIPSFVQTRTIERTYESSGELSSEAVGRYFEMVKTKFGDAFSILSVVGSRIDLKREASSWCPMCDRSHDSDNPYMFVISGKLYMNCRRTTRHYFLGSGDFSAMAGPVENETDESQFMLGGYDLREIKNPRNPTGTPCQADRAVAPGTTISPLQPVSPLQPLPMLNQDVQGTIANVANTVKSKKSRPVFNEIVPPSYLENLNIPWSPGHP